MVASGFGYTDTVKVLLKHGATVDLTNVRIFDTSAIVCVQLATMYSGTSLQRDSKQRPASLQRLSCVERNLFRILTVIKNLYKRQPLYSDQRPWSTSPNVLLY